MIGKPEWFRPRHFGWGLGIRKKEGLLYIAAFIVLALAFVFSPLPTEIRMWAIGLIILVILLDTIHIMTQVYSRLDEREQKHQLLAETNASYVAVVSLAVYLGYLIVTASIENTAPDPSLIMPVIIILVLMSIAKGGTLLFVQSQS